MNNKQLIIILIAIIIAGCIILGSIYLATGNNDKEDIVSNNTTINKTSSNITEEVSYTPQTQQKHSVQKEYEDWQVDYETGEFDEEGKPIYRSVASTSGGQNKPGIYESYWSENGPISETRIG